MNIEDRTYKFYFKELQPGLDGRDGSDGVSPTVQVSDIENGHRVTITDAEDTKTFDVMNGEDGKDGKDGNDGFSPLIYVSQNANGHTVTITDAEVTNSFRVLNGISPLPSTNALTDYLLAQSYDNLLDLTSDDSPATNPVVRLTGNRVVETGLESAFMSSEKCFLISKTPKYLRNGFYDLNDDDFITFNYNHGMNLYCRISGLVQSMTDSVSDLMPSVIICARPSTPDTNLVTTCNFKCGTGGNSIAQFGDVVFPVDDGDLRHENITLRVAVMLVLRPYYQNADLSVDFYFGQIDLNSELAQNVNVFGSYNNSMYAEKAYLKDDLIVRNDRLYKANWDISKGNRMDSDYDIVPTSVSNELKEIRAMIEALRS